MLPYHTFLFKHALVCCHVLHLKSIGKLKHSYQLFINCFVIFLLALGFKTCLNGVWNYCSSTDGSGSCFFVGLLESVLDAQLIALASVAAFDSWKNWIFFFKNAWIFACAFQFSSKTYPCIFLAVLHFVSEKNRDKVTRPAQWTQWGSFVITCTCWCGASDKSTSMRWIIFFRVSVQILNFPLCFFSPSVCSFVRAMFYY